MCRPVRCSVCNKTTWAGCGMHVDQVMSRVPESQRCTCTAEERAQAPSSGSLWDSIKRAFALRS